MRLIDSSFMSLNILTEIVWRLKELRIVTCSIYRLQLISWSLLVHLRLTKLGKNQDLIYQTMKRWMSIT